MINGKLSAAALILFATASLAASAEGPKEGLWIEHAPDNREAIRPLLASVVSNLPSTARSEIGTTTRRLLPKVPVPRTGGSASKELRLMLETARVAVNPTDTFVFVFGEGRNTIWKVGTDVASHPKDFVIVPLEVKDRHRRAALDENAMLKSKVFSDFAVEEVSSTEFRVTLPPNLPAGEYAWVYVGSGALRSGLRVFDFKVGAPKAEPK